MPFMPMCRSAAFLAAVFLAACSGWLRLKRPKPVELPAPEHHTGPSVVVYDTYSIRVPIPTLSSYDDTLRLGGTKVYLRYDTLYRVLSMTQYTPRVVERVDTIKRTIYLPSFEPIPAKPEERGGLGLVGAIVVAVFAAAVVVLLGRLLLKL